MPRRSTKINNRLFRKTKKYSGGMNGANEIKNPRRSIRPGTSVSGVSVSSGITGSTRSLGSSGTGRSSRRSPGSSTRSGPGSGSSEITVSSGISVFTGGRLSSEISKDSEISYGIAYRARIESLGFSGTGSSGPGSSGSSGPGSSGPGSSGPGSSGSGSSVSSNASSISNHGDYDYDYNQEFDIDEFEEHVVYLMNEDTTLAHFDLPPYHIALIDAYKHYLENKHNFDGLPGNTGHGQLVRCGALLQLRLIGIGKTVPGKGVLGHLIIIFAGRMWNIGFNGQNITRANWNILELRATEWLWDHGYGIFELFFGFIYYFLYKGYWILNPNLKVCRTLFGRDFDPRYDEGGCLAAVAAIVFICGFILLSMVSNPGHPTYGRNKVVVERPAYELIGGGPTDSIYEKILQLLDSDQPIKSMVDELIDGNTSDINIVNEIIGYANDIPGFMEIYSKTPAKVFKSILEELNSTATTTIDEVKSILQKGVDIKLITKDDMEKSLNDEHEPKTILKFDKLVEIIFKLNGSFMARNFPRKSSTVSPKQRKIKSAPAALTSSGSMIDKNMNYAMASKRVSSRSRSRESRKLSRLPLMRSTQKLSRLPSMRSTRGQ